MIGEMWWTNENFKLRGLCSFDWPTFDKNDNFLFTSKRRLRPEYLRTKWAFLTPFLSGVGRSLLQKCHIPIILLNNDFAGPKQWAGLSREDY